MRYLLFLCAALFLLALPVSAEDGSAHIVHLQCEYLADPVGIDVLQPRLSWQLADARPGARQTAYQVLVASDAATLESGKGDLWDSGQVESDQSVHVVYAGKPLTSHQPCYWKVRIWNQDGKETEWSRPAKWSMGILSQAEWQANWLRYTKTLSTNH